MVDILITADTLTMADILIMVETLTMEDTLTMVASTSITIITDLSIREITPIITIIMDTLVTTATPGLFSHKFQDLALRESTKTRTHPLGLETDKFAL